MNQAKQMPNLCKTIAKAKKDLSDMTSMLDNLYTETLNEFNKTEEELQSKKSVTEQNILSNMIMNKLMNQMRKINKSNNYTQKEKDAILDAISEALELIEKGGSI